MAVQTKGNSQFPAPGSSWRGWGGTQALYVEEDESTVERILTTSARCVGEMCWVMCTMESMATSGLACTRLWRRTEVMEASPELPTAPSGDSGGWNGGHSPGSS